MPRKGKQRAALWRQQVASKEIQPPFFFAFTLADKKSTQVSGG